MNCYCRWIGGWTGAFVLNALIASYFLIFGVGFGIWAALANLISNVHQYSVFAKCYQVSCSSSDPWRPYLLFEYQKMNHPPRENPEILCVFGKKHNKRNKRNNV